MNTGLRSIRSAGQGSGSIEVTLPARLRPRSGLPCTLLLQDGLRPEIVLLPGLRPAPEAFARLWSLLSATLDIDIGGLPLVELDARLQPAAAEGRLVWTGGLALAAATPALQRLVALPLDWTADPAPLAALRRAWRQGVTLELTGD